ncbi:MAG: beta-galactosidase [Melioribacteraceae bacterium]
MKEKLLEDYFQYGSQYYRAPSPHSEDWEKDLKKMSELGFNTIKYWIQWRWNNPAEGEYYFDDIDKLMELSVKYNLKVMLNTIFDVAPAWIYKKYPDASMITLSGRAIGPQTQPHRQIGGLGYCFNHDGIMEHFFNFLQEAIKRYKDHPALEIWNVGSEPELTSSMAEMRAYADDAEKIGDMLCFCENCQTKFKKWVANKYGSLEKLNSVWNRNYKSVEEIEIPKTRNTFNDVIDWRMFFVYTLGENVKRRFELAKAIDKGMHPLMCHHVFIQGFPVTSTASDPWNVGRFGDLHGFTQMDDVGMIDILRSCAKGKTVVSAEMLMLPGYTLDMPENIDENDIKKFVFSGIAGNLKGFIFWQYRPEILGREAPTWGLSYLDGERTSWLDNYSKIGRTINKNYKYYNHAEPKKAEVAIIYNPENQVFAWAATGNEKSATDSLLGWHRALYNNNYVIDFIHPVEFSEELLHNYKVIVYPFPYVLNKMMADLLKEWVKQGGVLIGESYFGGWNMDRGHHEKVVPGFGLDEVFQAKQDVVYPAKNENYGMIIPNKKIFKIDSPIKGSFVKETFKLNGAKELASFDTGGVAATYSEYGKGKAILVGSYIGMNFLRKKFKENADIIAALVEYAVKLDKPHLSNNSQVRVDHLKAGEKDLVFVRNLTLESIEDEIVLSGIEDKMLIEQFGKETNTVVNGKIQIKLSAKEVWIYIG